MKAIRRSLVFCLAFSALFSVRIFAQKITVTDPPRGTTLTYTVVLLSGTLEDTKATEVRLRNPRIHESEDDFAVGQAYNGRFKILAPLRTGSNMLHLTCGDARTTFHLRYKRNNNPYEVRVVYLTDPSGSTDFQLHVPGESMDYMGKLRTAMKLMQTMTAVRMNDLGYGRRTFNLQLDENDEVVVNLLKSDDIAGHEGGGELWGKANHLIGQHFDFNAARYLVIPAFSRRDRETGHNIGHAALGGGSVACFGGGTLYAWPDNTDKAFYRMTDFRRINGDLVLDDSVGRNTYWANGSTCIGCCLHELGHTFGLPHSTYANDIMTRGHDRFFQVFLLREAPSAHNDQWYDIDPNNAAEWSPPSASTLIVSRWFANDDPKKWPRRKIEFKDDPEQKAFFVRAENGIACIQGHEGGDIKFHMAPEAAKVVAKKFPKTAKVPYEMVREKLNGSTVRVRIYDAYGHGYEHGDQTVELGM